LLALARELLLDELAPLLPLERRRDAHLIATVMAIVSGEVTGEGWQREIDALLGEFYGNENALSALQGGEGEDPPRSGGEGEVGARAASGIPRRTRTLSAPEEGDYLRRLAADLRNGAFETSPSRAAAARVILWRLTMAKLREANPQFLVANGLRVADRQGT
jgi:hypothetical protein